MHAYTSKIWNIVKSFYCPPAKLFLVWLFDAEDIDAEDGDDSEDGD